MSLRGLLKSKLTEEELVLVPSSFDIIGSKEKAVAIIELNNKITKKRKVIAQALMQQHKNVTSVLMKESARTGKYRIRKLRIIGGLRNTEVSHKESGCSFLIDPRKAYFSPREGAERLRVAEKIRNNEDVIVFFAGVGPFPIVLSKKSKAKSIVGIEINPAAVSYFRKNIKLNRVKNVTAIKGDVKKAEKKIYNKFDRVVMPLPEKSIEFFDDALKCLKEKGFVHLYFFSKEDEINKLGEKINIIAKKENRKIEITEVFRVLPYGPKIWKYRMDIAIS